MRRSEPIPPSPELDKFEAWIIARGRTEDTAALYRSNVEQCRAHPSGLFGRLTGSKLAPNTRRTNLAALSQWALYAEDGKLARQLKELRLPPANRVAAKIPLTPEHWLEAVKHLRVCKADDRRCPAMRPVLLIMAQRGLRVGDVIRIQRSDLAAARRSGILSFVAKGNKRLEWSAKPIAEQVEELLQHKGEWKSVRDLIGAGSQRSCVHRVRRALHRHAAELEIEGVHPHRFRRTYATAYLREMAGDPQAAVKLQKFMGWANLATAMSYVDAVDQVELDAIGDRLSKMLAAE
jgi:integrase/recombinase XerD